MLRLFATPKTTPTFPAKTCCVINLCTIPAFPTSQRCPPWLKSAAYDYYSSWVFLRFVRLDFVDFDFNGTRANALREYPDRWHIACGFVSAKRTLVLF